jgi:hypothetical protein
MLILLVEKPAAEFYIADPESDDERIPPTSTQSKKRQEPTRTFTKYVDFFLIFSYLKSLLIETLSINLAEGCIFRRN